MSRHGVVKIESTQSFLWESWIAQFEEGNKASNRDMTRYIKKPFG